MSQRPQPLFDNLANLATDLPADRYSQQQQDDYRLARTFIYSYRGSIATFSAYRRDIERLLHWTWLIANKTLQAINREDIEKFIQFCQKPPLTWIGTQQAPRFKLQQGSRITNSAWYPFVVTVSKSASRKGQTPNPKRYNLSTKSLQALFAVLGSFFHYLEQEGYVARNPVAQVRQKSKYFMREHGKQIIRRLSELQWGYVIETAEIMASNEPEIHERTLFVMNALYGMYLRISELAASDRWQPKMADFQRDMDGNWWFTTVGKGNLMRRISVSDAMLMALKRYRKSLGLPPLPSPSETLPLLAKQSGAGPITSTRHIRTLVQTCFDNTYERLLKDGFIEEAESLQEATVHWLRHTGISDDVKLRPREHVRDDAGHSSSAITDKYIDIELRERHASARKKVIKPESFID
jgi:site-specific recombinase XerD